MKHTQTQRNRVLQLLRQYGEKGINSYDLTFLHRIKQAPTRIYELKRSGHIIIEKKNPNRSVNYILVKRDVKTEKPLESPYVWVFNNETNTARYVLKSELEPKQEAFI